MRHHRPLSPGPFRPLLRLWYCRIRRVHDWRAFFVGKPYGFRHCSLCHLRDPERIIWEVEMIRQEFQRAERYARLGVAAADADSAIRDRLTGELLAYEVAQQRMNELLELMRKPDLIQWHRPSHRRGAVSWSPKDGG